MYNNKYKNNNYMIETTTKTVARRGRYRRLTNRVQASSGYRGVSERKGRYVAQLSLKNVQNRSVTFYIGSFDSAVEAHKARIKFINKLK